ncbi:MAG: diaminobutyrate acetyltransferase [Pseudomonadota bacterium]|nr:diaminobutyrate acetyltransferase [Pseudomonadota bacterium]
MTQTDTQTKIQLRHPDVEDGVRIWQLVQAAGTLDLNSCYAYLMVCRDFSATSVIAEAGDQAIGFVTGYRPPPNPDALFVWQVGVAPAGRGKGVAGRMLEFLINAEACRGVRRLITNVTPSNAASRALFLGFARRVGAPLEESPGFGAALFPEPSHEPERLLSIGPF